VTAQAASRAAGVAGDEFIDHNAPERLGGAVSETEVQTAHRLRVDQRRGDERAPPQHDLNLIPPSLGGRGEPVSLHGVDQAGDRISCVVWRGPSLETSTTADVDRRIPGPDDLRQQQRQTLVWTDGPPPALGGGVHRVDEAGPAPPDSWRRRLPHESSVDELGEMLTYRVVVKPEMLGQFGHVDGTRSVDD